MSTALRARAPHARQVFIICPYDDEYRPLLKGGFCCSCLRIQSAPRPGRTWLGALAPRAPGLADRRVSLGHPRSEPCSPAGPEALPRFKMPFECGVFYGALQFGTRHQVDKRFLLLDSEPYRPQRTMSDAAGLDPKAHHDNPPEAINCVRDFLASGQNPRPMGAAKINALYQEFQNELPRIAQAADLQAEELEPLPAFNDWHFFAAQWLLERSRRTRQC